MEKGGEGCEIASAVGRGMYVMLDQAVSGEAHLHTCAHSGCWHHGHWDPEPQSDSCCLHNRPCVDMCTWSTVPYPGDNKKGVQGDGMDHADLEQTLTRKAC